jgi:hypothetical protein
MKELDASFELWHFSEKNEAKSKSHLFDGAQGRRPISRRLQ